MVSGKKITDLEKIINDASLMFAATALGNGLVQANYYHVDVKPMVSAYLATTSMVYLACKFTKSPTIAYLGGFVYGVDAITSLQKMFF